ncbi:2101_t:CDS:2 [Acaulospora colombiana]|uniref:2101_t:CDS:1 n=1 Tax=Acaulospora colombiana TaxID=27376 RepID=A0ACA9MNH1_9GLOM|nr:2101_t:CDS:2 [Acaulospora colombiana]
MENYGDTSTQSSTADNNDTIDVEADETIEVLQTSNNSDFLA